MLQFINGVASTMPPSRTSGTPAPPVAPEVASWVQAGSEYSSNKYTYVAPLSGDDFAIYEGEATEDIKTMRFTGTGFIQVGNALDISSITPADADGIIKITQSKVVHIDHTSNRFFVYAFDGTDWTEESGPYDYGDTGGNANGSYLEDNSIVVWSGTIAGNDTLQKLTYNGSTFTKVGNALAQDGGFHMVVGLSADRCAVIDTLNDEVRTYDFDGSDWAQVGNAYTMPVAGAGFLGGAKLDTDKILYWSGNNVQALKFDGTDWATEGTASSIGASSWPRSMAALEGTLYTTPTVVCHYYGGLGKVKAAQATLA